MASILKGLPYFCQKWSISVPSIQIAQNCQKSIRHKHIKMGTIAKTIQTFVFFDLETTGLIMRDSPMPRITELAMVAVSRASIHNNNGDIPRATYKLVLPINPVLQVSSVVEGITGLSNENLSKVQAFSENTNCLLIKFLGQLQSPLCIVAHNGDRFDYPILVSQLKEAGTMELGQDIYTIDSLHFFRHYFGKIQSQTNAKFTGNASCAESESKVLLNDGNDTLLSDALDNFLEISPNSSQKSESAVKTSSSEPLLSKRSEKKGSSLSQSTQKPYTPKTSYTKKMQEINEKTPESQTIRISRSAKNVEGKNQANARRQLDFSDRKLINYRLGTIYSHIFGVPSSNNHTAEGDCITLLKCATKLGNCFTEWADHHAVSINCKMNPGL